MQTYRIYSSSPKIIKPTPSTTRKMAYCTPFGYRVVRRSAPAPMPAFFPHAAAAAMQADFSPLLRLFNEFDSLTSDSSSSRRQTRSTRPFQPRFDVREERDAYLLHGELPGIDQKDIAIEFTDPSTLVVRGRSSVVREHSPAAAVQAPEQAKAIEQQQQQQQGENVAAAVAAAEAPEVEQAHSDTVSESGSSASNYHRPSVEDERDDEDWTDAAPETATPATAATTTTTTVAETKQPEQQQQQQQQQQQVSQQTEQPQPQQTQQAPSGRYWVSERSVGQFQRTFSFAGQVDQDGVTASLKNGVLSIVVPKLQIKLRKINVE